MPQSNGTTTVNMCDGDLRAWIDQETIMLKAVDCHGDPVELNEHEVRLFIQELLKLTDTMNS